MEEIFEWLLKEPILKFSAFFRLARNKMEAITIFLALLELVRQQKARASQSERFGEIEITREAF